MIGTVLLAILPLVTKVFIFGIDYLGKIGAIKQEDIKNFKANLAAMDAENRLRLRGEDEAPAKWQELHDKLEKENRETHNS